MGNEMVLWKCDTKKIRHKAFSKYTGRTRRRLLCGCWVCKCEDGERKCDQHYIWGRKEELIRVKSRRYLLLVVRAQLVLAEATQGAQ